MDLSIVIPARNEEFLARTIEDILEHIEGDTEVIAVLDGKWASPAIKQHPKVTVIRFPESIGQRAATNMGVRLSKAKYIMKVDAHCAFDQGFDVKMMREMHDDWTMVPVMRNLHVFNWKCKKCGNEWYQGPTPEHCCKDTKGKVRNENCDSKEFERVMVWKAKESPKSTSFRFDSTLHFQYWGDYKKKQEGMVVPTMSIQGSCFMVTREKYWELDLCSEDFNSWGQQGVEVACKTWLSGGKLMCNKNTWYAHTFRTQGGDFGFPYPNPQSKVEENRNISRDLFINNKWPNAKRDFRWILDEFDPPEFPTKGIIFYTDNKVPIKLGKRVREQIRASGLPIVSSSLKPLDFGTNIVHKGKRGYLTMFKQILEALEKLDTDVVFFCEHDVFYHPSHFDWIPPRKDVFYYNNNVWKWNGEKAVKYRSRWLSQLCAYRELMIKHYRKRIQLIEEGKNYRFEPGTRKGIDAYNTEYWESKYPNVDIRYGGNLTGVSRFKPEDFKSPPKEFEEADEVPYWGKVEI